MIQLSPDNGTDGWDWCGGYNYADSVITGFSHTHFSGTGIGDLLDISLMPVLVRTTDLQPAPPTDLAIPRTNTTRKESSWATRFAHADETAQAAYYRVRLANGITAELTASELVGVHRYTFPSEYAGLVIDLGFAVNWDKTTNAAVRLRSNTVLTGYRFSTGWARGQRVFFAIEFSRPALSWCGARDSASVCRLATPVVNDSVYGNGDYAVRAFVAFTNQARAPLTVKVALSSASEEGALANLRTAQKQSFDHVRRTSEQQWGKELGTILVEGDVETDKTLFYTALYHSFLAPNRLSDARGEYTTSRFNFQFDAPHTTHQRRTAQGFVRYDTFSLWDTFRAVHPLFTLVQPKRNAAMMRSLLAHRDEFGVLPVWSFWGTETKTMTGYHAVPVLVDACLKGMVPRSEWNRVFEALRASALEDTLPSQLFAKYRYVPHDKNGFSVTKTLEFSFDDWCIAEFAKRLNTSGRAEVKTDERLFGERSAYWQNVFEPTTRFMRAKLSNGSWKVPFDPTHSEHGFDAEYIEANAWQYNWFVPHDVAGLSAAHGGEGAFVAKLDSLFTLPSAISGTNASVDISGLVGQYAHGNEPSHHIPYLYASVGAASKTQERVRQIIRTFYNTSPDGLCGNDDCGQLSAWLVWSMMGFYPMNPASGVYVLGTPLFKRVTLRFGKTSFVIRADNVSEQNIYIAQATLNGKPVLKPFVRHEDLLRGGELRLEMSATPTPLWNALR
jgi:predicted alpha-1,2-mannosidase